MNHATLAVVCAAALLLAGCSARHYRKSADNEAARVIAEKTPAVPNMDTNFTVEPNPRLDLADLPQTGQSLDFFGADADKEIGARVISLEQALALGVRHSPNYQTRKEVVFLQALALTLARHRFTPIFSAGANASLQSQTRDVAQEIDRLAGTQSALLQQGSRTVQEYSVTGQSRGGVAVLLRSGARLGADFTTDFLRFVSGDPRFFTSSRLGATLTQPVLRGAGYKATMENLTQAERDLLYALREFTQFRKEFAVQVSSTYYLVLQNKDRVRNAWLGFQNFKQNVERERSFAEEGQRTQAALGQLQQAQLTQESQWINALRNYEQTLDQFKILVGVPVDEKIALDDQELGRLSIEHPEMSVQDALNVAVSTRLDLHTARDQFEDAGRRTGVAKNALLPDLNLILTASVDSKPGNAPLNLDFDRVRWTAGMNGNLPLDRKAERNSYRASIISYERAGRALQLAIDQVKLNINDAWRNLDQARRNHQLSEIGVELSERRVQEQELLAELGRGTARDLVDARTDLINAQNQRTGAVVQHTIARLQFWRDLGILYINDRGQWDKVAYAEKH